jgi:hypothetical protein
VKRLARVGSYWVKQGWRRSPAGGEPGLPRYTSFPARDLPAASAMHGIRGQMNALDLPDGQITLTLVTSSTDNLRKCGRE